MLDPASDDVSDFVSKSQSGSTITFSVDTNSLNGGASFQPTIQAIAPGGGQLSSLSINELYDRDTLIA